MRLLPAGEHLRRGGRAGRAELLDGDRGDQIAHGRCLDPIRTRQRRRNDPRRRAVPGADNVDRPRHRVAGHEDRLAVGLGHQDATFADACNTADSRSGGRSRAAAWAGSVASPIGRPPERRQTFVNIRFQRAAAEIAQCGPGCR